MAFSKIADTYIAMKKKKKKTKGSVIPELLLTSSTLGGRGVGGR